MKDIKKIVYDIMKDDTQIITILGSADQIHYQNDDPDENRAKAIFDAQKPIITYHRISEKVNEYPKRVSLFQITAWSKDNRAAETLKNALVECFNRRKNNNSLSYVELTDIASDIYDPDFEVWGIPMTFVFIYRDVNF